MCGVQYTETPVTSGDAFNIGSKAGGATALVSYYLQ